MNKFSRINVSATNVEVFRCILNEGIELQQVVDDLTDHVFVGAVAYNEPSVVVFFKPGTGFSKSYETLVKYNQPVIH